MKKDKDTLWELSMSREKINGLLDIIADFISVQEKAQKALHTTLKGSTPEDLAEIILSIEAVKIKFKEMVENWYACGRDIH